MKAVLPEQTLRLAHPVARYHVYQGETNDCGPYCVAIVSNTLYRAHLVHADLLADELSRRGLPDRIPHWATTPWGVVSALRRLGLRAHWRLGQRMARLFTNLREDRMTIVVIGEPLRFVRHKWGGWAHYKILSSWEPGRGLGFVDPGTSHPTGMTWQTVDEFRRQWIWMGRQIIEVGGAGDA